MAAPLTGRRRMRMSASPAARSASTRSCAVSPSQTEAWRAASTRTPMAAAFTSRSCRVRIRCVAPRAMTAARTPATTMATKGTTTPERSCVPRSDARASRRSFHHCMRRPYPGPAPDPGGRAGASPHPRTGAAGQNRRQSTASCSDQKSPSGTNPCASRRSRLARKRSPCGSRMRST